jgi:hypothetical protein
MRLFLVLFLCLTFGILNGQLAVNFSKVDKLALQLPDSLSKSTDGIAKYINENFSSQPEKSRAIFVWIARNINYDIENIFAINFYQNSSEVVAAVMKSRKGICMHFAELFNEIAGKSSIQSVVIKGYTKQNGFVDYIPHAWCAARIDSVWCLFDPAWGSGYVQNSKFVKKLNDYYFLTRPEVLIKSHIPFDQMWELLNYPVTNQEFYEGKTQTNKNKVFFNFSDSIRKFNHESEIGKLISSTRRMENNGIKNSIIFDIVQHNKREIDYLVNKQIVEEQNLAINIYNDAANLFNSGINELNKFIDYRNHQFTPGKTDPEIRDMLSDPEAVLDSAKLKLKSIRSTNANLLTSVSQLNRSLDEAYYNLNEQKAFLDKYFKTGKLFRKSLFYNYSWMGIPLKK